MKQLLSYTFMSLTRMGLESAIIVSQVLSERDRIQRNQHLLLEVVELRRHMSRSCHSFHCGSILSELTCMKNDSMHHVHTY